VGEAFLTPTRLYPRAVRAVLDAGVDVHAMSHITGGGLPGNLPRVLPDGLGVRVGRKWPRPAVFDFLAKTGPVEESEMLRTFNCGVGFVIVIAPGDAARASEALRAAGEAPFELGTVVRLPATTPFEERVVFP
jgi:phosphoribosylformylglycinamidine cyclo-ligase